MCRIGRYRQRKEPKPKAKRVGAKQCVQKHERILARAVYVWRDGSTFKYEPNNRTGVWIIRKHRSDIINT